MLMVVGFALAAVAGGVCRHLLVRSWRRGLDLANLAGCALAGWVVGAGVDGSVRTIVLTAGCGSLTSFSGVLADRGSGRAGTVARVTAGVVVVVVVASVSRPAA
ncbi:MAG: hypothetical protein RIR49_954 [Actinomycetota bacterium]|jgi:hypothetical protein